GSPVTVTVKRSPADEPSAGEVMLRVLDAHPPGRPPAPPAPGESLLGALFVPPVDAAGVRRVSAGAATLGSTGASSATGAGRATTGISFSRKITSDWA